MISVNGEGWIGEKYYPYIGYLPAKECDFNKENFFEKLKWELMDNIELLTDIQEGYYRIKKSDFFERSEHGEYCYVPCAKGKGATLYYYAGFKCVEEKR